MAKTISYTLQHEPSYNFSLSQLSPFTMKCIQLHCHFLPFHSKQLILHKQKVKINQKLLRLSTHESTNMVTLHTQNISSSHQPAGKTKAISDSLVVAVTSPVKPDIQVLIQTSAVMIFFYGIANFVVPYFVSKSLGLDQKLDDSDDNLSKDETGEATSKQTSQTQKQDFDRTKV